jgi:hypothetical protein
MEKPYQVKIKKLGIIIKETLLTIIGILVQVILLEMMNTFLIKNTQKMMSQVVFTLIFKKMNALIKFMI